MDYDILRGQLRQKMNDLADVISTDGCKSFDEYRYQCGVIHGLAIAERELLDLQEKIVMGDEGI